MASKRGDTIAQIGQALSGAEDAPIMALPSDAHAQGGRDDDNALDAPLLPPGCPVTPLGMLDQKCYYLDRIGQIIGLEAGQRHGINSLNALFSPNSQWLWDNFPRWSEEKRDKDGVVTRESQIVGFKQDAASRALIDACARRGIFDPDGRVRRAGAYRGSHDALILHCGNAVMRRTVRINGEVEEIEWFDTGLHGDFVYPAQRPIPRPWPEPVPAQGRGDAPGPGEVARAMIASWNWKRPLLDPLLILGGIGCGFLGGAFDWRANIWITGGRGTGKSTLNGKRGMLADLFGDGALRSADPSAAYIRQRLNNSTVPVFLDELEAEEDGRRTKAILELARVASSGDDAGRGGQDHQAVSFTLQSQFWASSILVPPMEPQDRSRWAVCALKPLPANGKKPDFKAARLPELGRKLMRRMVDGWGRWGETLEAYQDALSAMGHTARTCDQFGTLLACADLLLYDDLPDIETIEHIASLCNVNVLREVSDSAEEHELCLMHLRTTMVQSRGGDERESIGTWIGSAVQEICDPSIDGKYHRRLQELGLKLVSVTQTPGGAVGSKIWTPGEAGFLAVANSHQGISHMFAGKKWANGVWAQALGRCPEAIEGVTVKMAKSSLRATLVPLDQVIDESEIPAPARWKTEAGAP